MKNRIAVVLICFVLMFFVVSCDDQEKSVGYGSMSVEISNSDNSKTIQPTDESLAFTSYTIKGRYGTNEEWTVKKTFSSKSIEIDHLEVGNWEFVVEGFNTDGVLLAKSEPHVVAIKTNGLAKETYTLDWIDGFGSLKLSVKVQSSRVSAIECQLYDGNGNVVGNPYAMEKENSILQDDGFYLFEKVFEDVPTGFYNASIIMKDKNGEPIGKTLHQSVHIHDGLESSFEFSWKGFSNLMPQVDVPKPSFEDGTSIPCDSKVLLGTEEEGTSIFYSFDGKSYSSYTEAGIDLSQMQDLSSSIKIWVYAEKSNLNKSEIGTYSFSIEHELEYHAAKASTCTDVGWDEYVTCARCDYTTYNEIPTGHVLEHHVEKKPTCTEIGWSAYDTCTRCEYTMYKEIAALRHNYLLSRVDDEYHGRICSRCKNVTDKELHSFDNYKCEICGTLGRGPSGGYVFYDRGEYTGGEHSWRYLEAAPADLCVVNGSPTVDSTMDGYSNGTMYFIFGYYRTSSNGINILLSTKTGIGEGYSNTDILVSNMKDAAYTSSSGTGTTSSYYAARLCDVLEYEVNGEVFKDWFLSSKDELNLMYENLHEQGLGSFADGSYWSSSEDLAYYAWEQFFSSGNQDYNNRYVAYRVRPVRAF